MPAIPIKKHGQPEPPTAAELANRKVYFLPKRTFQAAIDGHQVVRLVEGRSTLLPTHFANHLVGAGHGKILPGMPDNGQEFTEVPTKAEVIQAGFSPECADAIVRREASRHAAASEAAKKASAERKGRQQQMDEEEEAEKARKDEEAKALAAAAAIAEAEDRLKPLTAEEVVAAGYAADVAPDIAAKETANRAAIRKLMEAGSTYEAAAEQVAKGGQDGAQVGGGDVKQVLAGLKHAELVAIATTLQLPVDAGKPLQQMKKADLADALLKAAEGGLSEALVTELAKLRK